MVALVDYSDLPAGIRGPLFDLEAFISDLDGKTVCSSGPDGTFIDEGTVDADDAVKAINRLVAALRSQPT